MELLDQYLKSVRSCLPAAQRDDIISELSENLRAQIEDREGELSRSLDESEVEAILKQHGHPLVVASRYRQDQRSVSFGRQIIGPVLFPFYIRVLSFNLGLTGIVILIVLSALIASGKSITLLDTLPTFLYQFLIQFGVITLIFALADRHWTKHPDRWSPRGLKHPWHPAFGMQTGWKDARSSEEGATRVSTFDSIAQFVALGVTIGWLRVAQHSPFMILGPAAAFIKPAPIWQQLYWPIVALALAGMAQAGVNLLRPDWVRLRTAYQLLSNVVWLVILFFLLRAGSWIVIPEGGRSSAEDYRRTAVILNQCLYYTLIGLSVVAAFAVFRYLRRLFRREREGSGSAVHRGTGRA
jgi:hypothetical protein